MAKKTNKTPKTAAKEPVIVKGYKGFDENMQCRGMQYVVGETAAAPSASLCNEGLHFCEYPLDVFGYYPPANSKYAEVEGINPAGERRDDDSKRVTTELKVKADITIPALVKASVDFILSKVDSSKTESNTGYQSAATNTGYQSAATNTGDWSAATNTGYQSAATNTGYWSAATNTGDQSAATVKGKDSVAIVTGMEGKARASLGSWIVLTEREQDEEGFWRIKDMKCARIDGEILKPGIFYTLKNSEIVEAEQGPFQTLTKSPATKGIHR